MLLYRMLVFKIDAPIFRFILNSVYFCYVPGTLFKIKTLKVNAISNTYPLKIKCEIIKMD